MKERKIAQWIKRLERRPTSSSQEEELRSSVPGDFRFELEPEDFVADNEWPRETRELGLLSEARRLLHHRRQQLQRQV